MIFLDCFSGQAADLKSGQRNSADVLTVLAKSPRVSTWDMSELSWLRTAIEDLERSKLIVELGEEYPWHRYALTDAGHAVLENRRKEDCKELHDSDCATHNEPAYKNGECNCSLNGRKND